MNSTELEKIAYEQPGAIFKAAAEFSENIGTGVEIGHGLLNALRLKSMGAGALSAAPLVLPAIGALAGAASSPMSKSELKQQDKRGMSNILLSGFGVPTYRRIRRLKSD